MSEKNEKAGEMGAAPAETVASAAARTHIDDACESTGNRLQPECDVAAEAHDIACDVVIVGCGVAGLYCALNLPSTLSVVMLAKTTVDECDSMLAQGGICVQHDDADYAPFFEDTLRAGHYENRCESVDLMIRASRSIISDLVKRGVDFELSLIHI